MVAFGVVRIWGHGEIKPGLTELVDTIKKTLERNAARSLCPQSSCKLCFY